MSKDHEPASPLPQGSVAPGMSVAQLSRRLLHNSAMMIVSRALSILTLLLAVPVIVGTLGPEGFGVWELMMAVASVAALLELAVGGTLVWRISMGFATAEQAETRRLVGLGVTVTLALFVLLVPPAWLLRDALLAWLQVPPQWSVTARWLLPATVATMVAGGINEALIAAITGHQRAGVAAVLKSIGLAVTNLTSIGLLWLGFGLASLLYGFVVGHVATFMMLYPAAHAMCGAVSLRPVAPTRAEVAVLGPFAGLVLATNLTVIARDQADKVILAALASPAAVGYFAIGQRLSSLVMQTAAVVYPPLIAAISVLYGKQDREGAVRLYGAAASWLALFAGMTAFVVCTLHSPLLVLWLGADQPQAHAFLALHLLGVTAVVMFAGAAVALTKGMGKPGWETTFAVVTLVLAMLSKPIFIAVAGPVGAVAASAASWGIAAAFLLFAVHRKLRLLMAIVWRNVAMFALTVLFATIGWAVASTYEAPAGRVEAAMILLPLVSLLALAYLSIMRILGLVRVADLPSLRSPLARPPRRVR